MNQIAGPSSKLLKVIGLSEAKAAAYVKDLIAMRQQAIEELDQATWPYFAKLFQE